MKSPGTWHRPSEPYDASKVHEDIKYTKEDDQAIDDWVSGKSHKFIHYFQVLKLTVLFTRSC